MRAAVSIICGVAARACFVLCLHVSSVAIRQLSALLIFVDHYLGRITALFTIFAV